ncbi:MAG: 3-deoxy-manno-octulosonate cytidylyltransferase [Bacteroidales bacterium]|nr:3-deoxy-manno-octulosonate cytidylyltransferase [Bacteroidales bacterium]
MTVTAAIPARLESTRLPRKILVDLAGRPLLWHVWQRTCLAACVDRVVVVTDSTEVQTAVQEWGGAVVMSSPGCVTGTDRLASVLDQLAGDLILNVQGDQPLLDPVLLDRLVTTWSQKPDTVVTPIYRLTQDAALHNPATVKVVIAANGEALYFSRSAIPYLRRKTAISIPVWGHIGVYAFPRAVLQAYSHLPVGPLEQAEVLEQLRLLENGIAIRTMVVPMASRSVDTAEDLHQVRAILAADRNRGSEGPT